MSPASPWSADLALRADGLLRVMNDAGVLSAADVHLASRLGVLVGESDDRVLLAAALAVRSTRQGSVVVDLARVADTVVLDAEDPDATTPDETTPDETTPDETTPDGTTPDATAPDGTTPDGGASAGASDLGALPWPEPGAWVAACAASALTTGDDAPLRLHGTGLWLARYDAQERLVVDELRRRTAAAPDDLDLDVLRAGLDRLFPAADADQRLAAAVCALSRVSVLAGGPGTGKTTTVSKVLALLREQHPTWRVALAAPTGKAAARLDEAVASSSAGFAAADRERVGRLEGTTVHRLLGWRPGSRSRFRHDRTNRLPYEVVVVDEASMVPLTLMARLLEALRDTTRLVLVGDPDQLASVEAGAVLGDLVDRGALGSRTARAAAALDVVVPGHGARVVPARPAAYVRDGIAALTVNHRFDAASAIGRLADAVRDGRVEDAVDLLRDGAGAPDAPAGPGRHGVELVEVADDAPLPLDALAAVERDVVAWGTALRHAALAGDPAGALRALDGHRLLCAHRRGPRGVQQWEALSLRWLVAADPDLLTSRADGHHPGEPLLVTTNDYEVNLFNGDTGVVVADRAQDDAGPGGGRGAGASPGADHGGLRAWFARGGRPVGVPLVRLGSVRPVHAMTVHRSQGSQFGRVTVVLPTADSPLATRETVYTALTRAVSHVRVVGSVDAFAAAVARPAARATGLRRRLAED
ncbi:exodeoxyribonuclease V subunit alpha [Aquipuribacter sp. SD81]|uniref:exodeoxyribonuclease V subunit alpha n=1 Tax=Aquipuribacter sp. SD81 TaxID=3127703 RepID=UPI003019B191